MPSGEELEESVDRFETDGEKRVTDSDVLDGQSQRSRGSEQNRAVHSRRQNAGLSSRDMWSLSGIGLEIVASILGLGLVGWWLDSKFGSSPWLLLTGLVLGIVGGLYNAYKQAMKIEKGLWSATRYGRTRHLSESDQNNSRKDHQNSHK